MKNACRTWNAVRKFFCWNEACAMPGMFEDHTLEENYAGLTRELELSREENAALGAAAHLARASKGSWLAPHYRWLDARWSRACA